MHLPQADTESLQVNRPALDLSVDVAVLKLSIALRSLLQWNRYRKSRLGQSEANFEALQLREEARDPSINLDGPFGVVAEMRTLRRSVAISSMVLGAAFRIARAILSLSAFSFMHVHSVTAPALVAAPCGSAFRTRVPRPSGSGLLPQP